MTGMRPLATACTLAVLLGAAAFAYANFVGSPEPSHFSQKRSPVTITGSVENLQPGMATVMVARARNNTGKRLIVRKLRLRVRDASAECPSSMLQTRTLRRRNALPSRRTRTIPIQVTLVAGAPDACQDATFPLRFSARARLAGH
jgi:hypothetical protein